MSAFVLTPLATDNFVPNANPLNPAKWSQSTDGQGEFEPLQALNGTCVATSDDQIDFCGFYTGISSPNDQYVTIVLNSIVADGSSGFTCFLRSSSDASNQYDIGIYNVDASHLRIVMSVFVDGVENDFATLDSFTYTNGDAFTFIVIGTTLYVLQNGTQLLQGTDSTFASGLVGIDINPFTTPNASAVILSGFVTGAASLSGSAYSLVDDRDFSVFPNNPVDVQGTETYTVPAHPSYTTPVDSRVSKPVDSRVASIIPLNSRVTP